MIKKGAFHTTPLKMNNFNRMKTWTKIFVLGLVMALFFGCEGIPGPPGRDGIDGEDGDSFLGSVFEIDGDFVEGNNYQLFFEFPGNFEVFNSDVVLVYILWEQVEDDYGEPVDVWRLLPQTVVLDEGVLQYNFDYTFSDVQIYLDGTIDPATALPAETQDQVFRIVVLPAAFAREQNVDVSNFSGVINALKLSPDAIQKVYVPRTESDVHGLQEQ